MFLQGKIVTDNTESKNSERQLLYLSKSYALSQIRFYIEAFFNTRIALTIRTQVPYKWLRALKGNAIVIQSVTSWSQQLFLLF